MSGPAALPYVLMLHGRTGLSDDDWQNVVAGELAGLGVGVDVPRFTDPDEPEQDVWLTELGEHLAAAPRDTERVVLAHSLGATLWLHHAARLAEPDPALRVDRALLVSTPDPISPRWAAPELAGFAPTPLDAAGLRRSTARAGLVVGDDDPLCPLDASVALAAELKVDLDVIRGGGHLHAGTGYGHWPSMRDWVLDRHTRIRANVPAPVSG